MNALSHAVLMLMLMQCLELCANKQQQERKKAEEKPVSSEYIFFLNLPREGSVLNFLPRRVGFQMLKGRMIYLVD
jgi:hypothetical protein